jgi:hypothetical protein
MALNLQEIAPPVTDGDTLDDGLSPRGRTGVPHLSRPGDEVGVTAVTGVIEAAGPLGGAWTGLGPSAGQAPDGSRTAAAVLRRTPGRLPPGRLVDAIRGRDTCLKVWHGRV